MSICRKNLLCLLVVYVLRVFYFCFCSFFGSKQNFQFFPTHSGYWKPIADFKNTKKIKTMKLGSCQVFIWRPDKIQQKIISISESPACVCVRATSENIYFEIVYSKPTSKSTTTKIMSFILFQTVHEIRTTRNISLSLFYLFQK